MTNTPLLGVYVGIGTTANVGPTGGPATLDQFTAFIGGRQPDLITEFVGDTYWSDIVNDFNLTYGPGFWKSHNPERSTQTYANIVTHMPLLPVVNTGSDSTQPTMAEVIAPGYAYNTCYAGGAQSLASIWPNAFVRLGIEYNANSGFAWCWSSREYTEAQFQACYALAANALRAASSGFKLVWNPSFAVGGDGSTCYPRNMQPNPSLVDVLGLDIYASDYTNPSSTSSPTRWADNCVCKWGYYDIIHFAVAYGKPIALPEWGAGTGSAESHIGDEPWWMKQITGWLDWMNMLVGVAYHSYWNTNAGDVNSKISDGTFPLQGDVYKAYVSPRSAPLIGTGMPVVVQDAIGNTGAVALANPATLGNMLVAIVAADNNAGVANVNNGFHNNHVGLTAGISGWKLIEAAGDGANRGLSIFTKPVSVTNPSTAFTLPANWRGVVYLAEVQNLASISAVQGVATAGSGSVSITNKVPSLSLPLAVAQWNSSASSAATVTGVTAGKTNRSLTAFDAPSGVYHGAAVFDATNQATSLQIAAGAAITAPIYTTVMLNGRAALPSTAAPTIVQSVAASIGGTATLASPPTVGNTLIAIMTNNNNGGAGGIKAPPGWTMVADTHDFDVSDGICIAMMPVTDPSQTTAAFQVVNPASVYCYTTLLEVSGNVSVEVLHGLPVSKIGTLTGSVADFTNYKGYTLPYTIFNPAALNLWAYETSVSGGTVSIANTPGATLLSHYAGANSGSQNAGGVVELSASTTNLDIDTTYNFYCPTYALLTIKPN